MVNQFPCPVNNEASRRDSKSISLCWEIAGDKQEEEEEVVWIRKDKISIF